jgi:hypothetical protein
MGISKLYALPRIREIKIITPVQELFFRRNLLYKYKIEAIWEHYRLENKHLEVSTNLLCRLEKKKRKRQLNSFISLFICFSETMHKEFMRESKLKLQLAETLAFIGFEFYQKHIR